MANPAHVVLLAGSPVESSRSSQLLAALGEKLRDAAVSTELFSVRDFDARALLLGDVEAPSLRELRAAVRAARGIVLATPVYKATYSGALKLVVDQIEPDALVGKFALAIATARLPEHFASLEQGVGSLYAFFRIARALESLRLSDEQLPLHEGRLRVHGQVERQLSEAARAIAQTLAASAALEPRAASR